MEESKESNKPFPWKVFSAALLLCLSWLIGLPLGYNLYWIYGTERGERYRTVGSEVEYSDRGKPKKGTIVSSEIEYLQSRSIETLSVQIQQVPQNRVDEFGNGEVGGGLSGTIDPYFSKPGTPQR